MKSGVRVWWMAAVMLGGIGLWGGIAGAAAPDTVSSGHRFHVNELETDCTTCHTTVEESTSAQDRNIPDHETCFDCHDGDTAPDDCSTCHTNPDEAIESPGPRRDIRFSHKAHIARGLECTTCHKQLNPDAEDEALVMSVPDMETCSSCHNGQKARTSCKTCHTSVATLRPKSHRPGWVQHHAEVAKADISACAQCHVQEADCDNCHRGDNLQGIPHREGFITSHAFSFYSKTKECAACHDFQVSCVSCHRSRFVYPANHSLANWRERHGDFAETDLEACAACHDDAQPTCKQSGCHDGVSNLE